MIVEKAYAKINLFLDVTNKREDGYHNILSIMQTIDWCDTAKIGKTVSNDIKIKTNNPLITCDASNTAYRAAKLFLEKIGVSHGLEIELEKNIPISAGMAGGSADAAAVLRGANRLFDSPLSMEDLLALGAKIGADVPFCLVGGTKVTRGIGDVIEDIQALPDCYLVCAKLGEGVSTPHAYSLLDKQYQDFQGYEGHRERFVALCKGLESNDLSLCFRGFYNIFEEVIPDLRPAVVDLKKEFSASAGVSMMSGSGPSVFGAFKSLEQAQDALSKAKELGAMARICRPVSIL